MTGAAVVLPTFAEAETAPAVVGELLEFSKVAEVIVVDDDSPDRTGEIVAERNTRDDVTVVIRKEESGLSSAVLRGFDEADADILTVMDADGQHPTGAAVRCARLVDQGADLAVGSRHLDTGQVAEDWPLRRRVLSHGAAGLAWGAVPPARQLSDPMSGLFAVRADIVDAVRGRLRPHGYKILLELLARCPVRDIAETGYTFRKREHGASNLGAREYARYLRHLGRLSVPARRGDSSEHPEVVPDGAD
jgi:Glycosyltransferases involved in cell wall biogenesis